MQITPEVSTGKILLRISELQKQREAANSQEQCAAITRQTTSMFAEVRRRLGSRDRLPKFTWPV